MSDRQISLTRQQLAKFLPSPEAIREFEKLFGQNTDLVITVENIIDGAGLANDGTYNIRSGTNYLDGSTSLYEDGTGSEGQFQVHPGCRSGNDRGGSEL